MSNPVLIIGAGTVGKLALEIYESSKVPVYGFLDEDESKQGELIGEVSVLGSPENEEYLKILGEDCDVIVASDEVELKRNMIALLKETWEVAPNNAIHATSYVSGFAELGHGNIITAGVALQGFSKIGSFNNLGLNTIIDTGATIGDYVHIGPGTIINSDVEIADDVFIGSGAIIVSGIKIGKGARIGAGSVVVANVPEEKTVFGNPAKEM